MERRTDGDNSISVISFQWYFMVRLLNGEDIEKSLDRSVLRAFSYFIIVHDKVARPFCNTNVIQLYEYNIMLLMI